MSRILIAYSTVDGHTRRICERMQRLLEGAGHAVTLASLSDAQRPDARAFEKVVIGASIRYGKHRQEVFDFIGQQRSALEDRPSAFFTVNAVARKPGKDTPEGSPYIRSFRKLTAWRPQLVGVFAGKIDYQRYGFVDRQVIRFIMWLTRGPTDPHACVEFTDWEKVEAFAREVGDL
ncbi:MAG TPA: menaquinone-dependent protoporphyrinogen IX dehydrogenase [Ramlibacter sp.]|uniref:menaquinone-dependent protoporphyrinogen IX dehydrogenase n=1 Tax=Ramlibacter sp. TaxID=1917967 RepID=UPI002D7F819D|nr:menaquinone-dependent protoporphyrinogen IX dehydrogenase [Ramlibacter sp.]HET8744162.1 menaquinone-dependent protoporphyrinogen IX dehydrogenase [Ramlibacter sp.]